MLLNEGYHDSNQYQAGQDKSLAAKLLLADNAACEMAFYLALMLVPLVGVSIALVGRWLPWAGSAPAGSSPSQSRCCGRRHSSTAPSAAWCCSCSGPTSWPGSSCSADSCSCRLAGTEGRATRSRAPSPHYSPGFVARPARRRAQWGFRAEERAGVLEGTSSTPRRESTAECGASTAAAEVW
jgi:hypothetical protein